MGLSAGLALVGCLVSKGAPDQTSTNTSGEVTDASDAASGGGSDGSLEAAPTPEGSDDSTSPSGNGDPENPVCEGSAVSCDLLNTDACGDVLGCSLAVGCVTVERVDNCQGLAPRAGCESVPGCRWDGEQCDGELDSCEALSFDDCVEFATCAWEVSGCGGGVVDCAALSAAQCLEQPGCELAPELEGSLSGSDTPSADEPGAPDVRAGLDESAGPEGNAGPAPEGNSGPEPEGNAGPDESVEQANPDELTIDEGATADGGVSLPEPGPDGDPAAPDADPATVPLGESVLVSTSLPELDASACDNTAEVNLDGTSVAGETNLISYGDGTSTHCTHEPEPGTVCLYGTVADAQPDYSNWGVSLGLRMAVMDEDGAIVEPFDATAYGAAIQGFRLRLDLQSEAGVRIGLNFAGYPEDQSLLYGGGNLLSDSAVIGAGFRQFSLPDWLEDGPSAVEPDNINLLSVAVFTEMGEAHDYVLCVSEFDWLDADGNVVQVTR